MLDQNLLFYLFSIALIGCAFTVIIAKTPIISLIFLVSSFLFYAFLLFLLECEFLALLFIIIYVGALAVFFLFAIMMLESKFSDLAKNAIKYLPISFVFSTFLLLPFLLGKISTILEKNAYSSDSLHLNKHQNWLNLLESTGDLEPYQILYSYFILQLLISGLILMLVLISVVFLTNNLRAKRAKSQSISKQLARTLNTT